MFYLVFSACLQPHSWKSLGELRWCYLCSAWFIAAKIFDLLCHLIKTCWLRLALALLYFKLLMGTSFTLSFQPFACTEKHTCNVRITLSFFFFLIVVTVVCVLFFPTFLLFVGAFSLSAFSFCTICCPACHFYLKCEHAVTSSESFWFYHCSVAPVFSFLNFKLLSGIPSSVSGVFWSPYSAFFCCFCWIFLNLYLFYIFGDVCYILSWR